MRDHLTQKDGASASASPASLPDRHRVASASQVSDNPRAKLRALAEAMGGKPCIVRWDDGRTMILSAEALRVVDTPLSHEALNA